MLTTRTQCQCMSHQVAIDAFIHVPQQGHGNSLRLSTLNVAQQSQHSTLSLPTTEGFSSKTKSRPTGSANSLICSASLWHTTSCEPANDSITIWMVPPSGVRVRRLWHSLSSSSAHHTRRHDQHHNHNSERQNNQQTDYCQCYSVPTPVTVIPAQVSDTSSKSILFIHIPRWVSLAFGRCVHGLFCSLSSF